MQFLPQSQQQFRRNKRNPITGEYDANWADPNNGSNQQFGANQQGQGNSSPNPLEAGAPLSLQTLKEGGFLGGAGKVKFDPYTGKEIAQDKRVGPLKYMTNQLVVSPALQEAQEFQFSNLGDNLAPQAAQGLLGAGQNALAQSSDLMSRGGDLLGSGANTLLGTSQRVNQAQGSFANDRERALNELSQLQRKALSPNLDPEQRMFFQDMADQRRAEVLSRFDEGGDVANLFNAQRNADVANLAARGVLDSTTAANTMAKRDFDFGALANTLLGQASEQSRQDLLNERSGIREASTAFGGIQGNQASSGGSLLNQSLGLGSEIGSSLGQLGLGQQNIGAELARTGLSGLTGAADASLAGRAQEADLQLGELGQRLLGSQTALQNIQSLVNNRFNRNMAQEQFELQKRIAEAAMAGPSWLSRIAGAVGGFASGGLPGAFVGGVQGV